MNLLHSQERRAFLLDCQQIVQPVPIAFDESMSRLRQQLTSNKLILVELEEVELTEEERLRQEAERQEQLLKMETELEERLSAGLQVY